MRTFVESQVKRTARWLSLDVVRKPRSLIDWKSRELNVDLALLASFLRKTKKNVFFILVGANDGVQTEEFLPIALEHQWTGCLLEPHPVYYRELARRFSDMPGIQCINAAIDHVAGERLLYSIKPRPEMPEWVTGLASFDRGHLLKHEKIIPGISEHIREDAVRCESFTSLLALLERDNFDVLQVDTEGYDAEIIRMADIPRRLPSIVRFEHKHLSLTDWDQVVALLLNGGYRVAKTGQDTLAFRDSI